MPEFQLDTLSSVLKVLTALIAPALLVSACGTFIISTSNRMAQTTERVRALVNQMHQEEELADTPAHKLRVMHLQREVRRMFRRVLIQQRALAMFYAAAVLFVGCSLTLGMEALTVVLPPWLPVALGLLGVAVLLGACAMLLLDVRSLVRSIREEMELVRWPHKEAKT